MAVLKRTPGVLILFVLVGGLVGGILGQILVLLSPSGMLKEIFLKAYHIGITSPLVIDLHLVTFTLGFAIRINLMILLGVILGFYTYRQS